MEMTPVSMTRDKGEYKPFVGPQRIRLFEINIVRNHEDKQEDHPVDIE